MKIVARGTVFPSEPGTDRQSCAFPQVTVLPGGRWLVACRAASTKGGNEGQHVALSLSDDQGRSWSPAASPFLPPTLEGKPGAFRMLGLTALGGTRVLATLYWVDQSDPAVPFFNEETEGLLDSRIMLTQSEDGGLTWGPPALIDTSPFNDPSPITGPVLLLPDGEWMCQFETNKTYYDTTPWVHSSVLMFSSDQGRTWPRHSVVTLDPRIFYWDQRPQVLPEGRIFDVFWTYDNRDATYLNIHARESWDQGRIWSALWDTGVPGQPAPVVALSEGRLALVYVDRTDAPAIRCRISSDAGRTWPTDSMLSLYESVLPSQTVNKGGMVDTWAEMSKFSIGLPATAALPGDEILVVYYAGPLTDSTSVEWVRLQAGA
jgi:hypothetical protein